jgi:hypothetical protein
MLTVSEEKLGVGSRITPSNDAPASDRTDERADQAAEGADQATFKKETK